MEFDKSRVYTAVNADELKVGSKVIVANTICALRKTVEEGSVPLTLTNVWSDTCINRFGVNPGRSYCLAYLVSEPEEKKLNWTDLKVGDVVRNVHSGRDYLVTGLDKHAAGYNVNLAGTWTDTDSLEMNFEKVTE